MCKDTNRLGVGQGRVDEAYAKQRLHDLEATRMQSASEPHPERQTAMRVIAEALELNNQRYHRNEREREDIRRERQALEFMRSRID